MFQVLLPLAFLLLPIVLLFLERKKPKDFAKQLSLSPMKPGKLFVEGLGLFGKIFIALYVLLFALALLGLLDTHRVLEVIRQQDAFSLLLAISLGPVAEEIFFRGYLQKRFGIVLSAGAFALLHRGYGSIAEVLGAFLVSLIFGQYVRKKNSILPPILAHAIYNAISILVASRI